MVIPDGFEAAPGREPPPTELDPTRSQRFTMLDGEMRTRDRYGSGFRGFGAGRTFPLMVNGTMQLRIGAVINVLEGFGRFTIKTRNATVNVLPSCVFRLDVDQSRTRVTCIRGKLYLAPQEQEPVAISGGQFRELPSTNGAMSVTEDRQAQADTTATLQAARELQELDAAQRDRLPF